MKNSKIKRSDVSWVNQRSLKTESHAKCHFEVP